jgi:antitoxin component of MazEF toxin-antitoxin module
VAKTATLMVQQWGNSLAVRIPSAVAKSAGFKLGQPVRLPSAELSMVRTHETCVCRRRFNLRPLRRPTPQSSQPSARRKPHARFWTISDSLRVRPHSRLPPSKNFLLPLNNRPPSDDWRFVRAPLPITAHRQRLFPPSSAPENSGQSYGN